MKNKKILFIYRTKREHILKLWKVRKGPDSLLFGANHLKKMGYTVDFFDHSYSRLNPLHFLFYPLEHAIINVTKMGFKLDQAVTLLPLFKNYDVIVLTGDSAGLPVLFLKYIKVVKKPVIFMTSGLAGAIKGHTNSWVGKLYKKILTSADVFTSYSQVEINFFEKEMGISRGKIKYMPLATDFKYFSQKSNQKKKIICAVGTELGRDYKTFFDAMDGLPIQAEVACHPDNIVGLKIPSNVKVHLNIPVEEVLKIYQRSIISVIPCIERYRSSGQMVVLESGSAGIPMIASEILGLKSAFDFKDNHSIFYIKPQSSKELRKKIKTLLNNPQKYLPVSKEASKLIKNKYTTKKLATTLSRFIQQL